MKLLSFESIAVIRSRQAWVRSTGDSSWRRRRSAASAIERNRVSMLIMGQLRTFVRRGAKRGSRLRFEVQVSAADLGVGFIALQTWDELGHFLIRQVQP